MLRDTSVQFKVSANLTEHRFINHNTDELVNERSLSLINDYLDIVSVDLFFRTCKIRPITIPKQYIDSIITPEGIKAAEGSITLDFSTEYDRVNFVQIMTSLYRKDVCKFASMFDITEHRYCGCSHGYALALPLYVDMRIDGFWRHTFVSEDQRTLSLFHFKDYFDEKAYERSYQMHHLMAQLHDEYYLNKKKEIFEGYTWEECLLLYTLLVEKWRIKENYLTPFLAWCLDKEVEESHPLLLDKFFSFEKKIKLIFNEKDCIDYRDAYLMFINIEKTKAFNFSWTEGEFLIQLFNGEIVSMPPYGNPLPLPYINHTRNKHI